MEEELSNGKGSLCRGKQPNRKTNAGWPCIEVRSENDSTQTYREQNGRNQDRGGDGRNRNGD